MHTGAIRIELIEERSKLPLSAEQWTDLVTLNETNTIFQTFEWFDAWWKSFGESCHFFFLVVRKGDAVIGFAPLMLRRALGLRQLEFVGTGNADYLDFILPTDKSESIAAISRFLRGRSSRWQRFRLCNIPMSSSTARCLRNEVGAGLCIIEEAQVPCPSLRLDRDLESVRHLIDRYSVRRPMNWFAKRGVVRFRHVTDFQELSELLPKFFDQHIRRWRAAGERSLFESGEQRAFYGLLAQVMLARGWLLFSVVELDGEPIAFHFGFDYRRSVTWYKPAFEPRYAEHSPGLLLIRQLIEDSLQRDRLELDFTIGDEAFKDRFANQRGVNLYLSMYHSRFFFTAAAWIRGARRTAGRLRRLHRAARRRVDMVGQAVERPRDGSAQTALSFVFRKAAHATAALRPAFWRSIIARRRGRAFDARYQTDTQAKLEVRDMQGVDPALARHAVHYEASAIPKFRRACAVIERALGPRLRHHSFIDFGSGKGLVVMLASRLPFRRVYGVEMTMELHATAEVNVRRFVERAAGCAPISLVCCDALAFPWPDGDIVAYLYNPFDETLTARFIERLSDEAGRSARSILVAYVNPLHRALFGRPGFRALYEHKTLCVYEYVASSAVAGRTGP